MNPLAASAHFAGAVTALSVNLNKVALLRNSRSLDLPSLSHAAQAVLLAGAQGITVHPRPDARHIRPDDITELTHLLHNWPHIEFNIEGNPLHNLLDYLAPKAQPHQVTFVPDSISQSTSDHGWQLPQDIQTLRPLVDRAVQAGSRVSLFMDAQPSMVAHAVQTGAQRIELYTENYAHAFDAAMISPDDEHIDALCRCLQHHMDSAYAAQSTGLEVNAGHDLNLHNLPLYVASMEGLREVSIGHAFIADALNLGYGICTRAYLAAIQMGTHGELRGLRLREAAEAAVLAARQPPPPQWSASRLDD